MGINLFSIGAATQMGMEVNFIDNKCYIYQDRELVLTGERAAKTMYHINIRSRESANAAKLVVSLDIAHQRLGHVDRRQIQKMFNLNLVDGLNLKTTKDDSHVCSGCAGGRMHRITYHTSTTPKATTIAGRIHSDVCGPMSHASLGGARYFVVFKDEFSSWTVVNIMKSKSEVLGHLKTLQALFTNQNGSSIKILRSDQGTEYVNALTKEWIQKMGILHEMSAPYTAEQNGTSERTNRTIMESARSMMVFSRAPPEFWAEAVTYATYIRNRIPSGQKNETPYQIIFKSKPDISNIRIFGSKTYVHIPEVKRKKLDPKCLEGFLIGFCDLTKGYRVFIPVTRKVVVSLDVIIDETIVGFDTIGKDSGIRILDQHPDPFTYLVLILNSYLHFSFFQISNHFTLSAFNPAQFDGQQ